MIRGIALFVLGAVLLLGAVACDPAEVAKWEEQNKARWDEFAGKGRSGGSGSGSHAGQPEAWTIECNSYEGPQRRDMAEKMAGALRRVSRLRADQVAIEHSENRSRVLYGEYKLKYKRAKTARDSPAQGGMYIEMNAAIRADLAFIRKLAMGDKFPFFSARSIHKPIADVGPPEWDLRNTRGAYTLHVGVTYPTENLREYKQAAVEWVRVLREEGHEAYYYHDPDVAKSDVCVGSFPSGALIEGVAIVNGREEPRQRYSDAVYRLRDQGDFRFNLENGHRVFVQDRNARTGKTARMPNGSFLVKIPQRGQSASRNEQW